MPHNLNKSKYKRKLGCGCKMCKPQKGMGADTRKLSDKKADVSLIDQLDQWEKDHPGATGLVMP